MFRNFYVYCGAPSLKSSRSARCRRSENDGGPGWGCCRFAIASRPWTRWRRVAVIRRIASGPSCGVPGVGRAARHPLIRISRQGSAGAISASCEPSSTPRRTPWRERSEGRRPSGASRRWIDLGRGADRLHRRRRCGCAGCSLRSTWGSCLVARSDRLPRRLARRGRGPAGVRRSVAERKAVRPRSWPGAVVAAHARPPARSPPDQARGVAPATVPVVCPPCSAPRAAGGSVVASRTPPGERSGESRHRWFTTRCR